MRWLLVLSLCVWGCDDEPANPEPPASPATETPDPEPEPEPEPEPLADPNEACVLGVVVSFAGANPASAGVTRSEDEARARAAELLARAEAGESLTDLARNESDARTSRARGGAMGTWTRDAWPDLHGPLKDPIFGLAVGQRTGVIETGYGYVVAERCPVEKVHTRHILIRYSGARNAPDDISRTQEEAQARASEVREMALAEGADFEALAREHSDDSSAERGGDLGAVGRGLLMPTYESAAFQLAEGGISDVVETDFGYHVIQRY